jgi:hypothetical protein
MNYLKKQGQASGATMPAHWQKWVVSLGRCGKERPDEKNNKNNIYILIAGKLTKRAKGIYKNVSNVQNLIFK